MISTAIQRLTFVLIACTFSDVASFEPSGRLFPNLARRVGRTTTTPSIRPTTERHAFLSTAIAAADAFWKQSPYAAAALVCGVKASAADMIAQRRQYHKRGTAETETLQQEESESPTDAISLEKKEAPSTDLQRNLVYVLYGALYQGMAQEYVYNHLYPVLFGAGTDVRTVLTKVLFDLLLQTTLITLPVAYIAKALLYRYSLREAFSRYKDDIQHHGLWVKYFSLWGPVQCLTFSVIPEHLRVTFIAGVSFFWLIILSSIASKAAPIISTDEECLLEDGQTCNIDG